MKIQNLFWTVLLGSSISLAQSSVGANGGSTLSAVPVVPVASDGNVLNQAQKAQKDNNSGTMMAGLAGMASAGVVAYTAGDCLGTTHTQCPLMAAGIAGIVISMMIGQQTSGAAKSAVGTQAQVTSIPQVGDKPTDMAPTNVAAFSADDANKALAGTGVSIDPKNNAVTMPGGKSLAMDKLAQGDMSQMGLSADGLKEAQSKLGDIMKKAQEKAGSADAVASTGGDSAGADASKAGYADPMAALKAGNKGLQPRAPTSVAGMKKFVNGEAIGVAGDSIFEMVKRRYDLKGQQNGFVVPPQ